MKNLISKIAFRIVGIAFGAIIGTFLGAGTGVVGSFGGVKGVIAFASIGGIVGFFAVPDFVRFMEQIGHLRKKMGKK